MSDLPEWIKVGGPVVITEYRKPPQVGTVQRFTPTMIVVATDRPAGRRFRRHDLREVGQSRNRWSGFAELADPRAHLEGLNRADAAQVLATIEARRNAAGRSGSGTDPRALIGEAEQLIGGYRKREAARLAGEILPVPPMSWG